MLSKIVRRIYGSYIPIINIQGTINSAMTEKIEQRLSKLSVSNSEALAVSINSCGGLPVQSEIIGKKIKTFAKNHNLKLLTFGRQIVASGGYLILAQGDEVYCDVSSVIGSIGVSIPKYTLKGGLDYLSIEQKKLKSNDNIFVQKLNPFNELSDAQTKRVKQICEQMHQKLIKQVQSLRGSKLSKDEKIFDGTLFTGEESKKLGLVDGVGSMIEILERKYPQCKLGLQKKSSFWNTILRTY